MDEVSSLRIDMENHNARITKYRIALVSLILALSVNLTGCDPIQSLTGQKYTLNVIPSSGNSGSGDVNLGFGKHTYNRNAIVTLTATPSSGSQFLSWGGDWSRTNESPDLVYQPTLTVQMNANRTIEVNFLLSYTLTLVVNVYGVNPLPPAITVSVVSISGDGPKQGFAGVMASGQTQNYFVGQDVTITTSGGSEGPSSADALGSQTAPTYGTRFEGWSGNVLGVGANATYVYSAAPSSIDTSQNNYTSQTITVHMAANTTLTANWYTYDENAPVP